VIGAGRRLTVAGASLVVAAGLAVGGCGSSNSGTQGCFSKSAAAGSASAAGGSAGPSAGRNAGTAADSRNPVAAGWTLPGGDLANTRDVASAITSSNVSTLGVAWCVPVQSTGQRGAAGLSDGYATTPVVVNGVVYMQDLESNVMAIELATGKVLWKHDYNSINGGPDGVNVVNGVVYAATDKAAVALNFSTVPPWPSITARAASKYRAITCRKLSGSSRSPKAVDPVTSQNNTDTVLRFWRGAGTATKAVPHPLQNLASAGFSRPQPAQTPTPARLNPTRRYPTAHEPPRYHP